MTIGNGPNTILFEDLPFFAGMDAELRGALAEIATTHRLGTGEYLFHQGDPAQSVYIVRTGGLQLVENTPDGKAVNLKLYGRGDFFGMLAISGEFPHPAGVIAAQDSEVIRLRATELRRMVQRHPALGLLFIDMLVDHTHHAHQRIRHLATERVGQRVARALLHFNEKLNDPGEEAGRPRVQLSQQDLAEFAGSTAETVNRTLRAWEDRRLIKRSRMHIDLLDPDGIRQIAEGESTDYMSRVFDGVFGHTAA